MKITKEELAKFSNCSVEDVENGISLGFNFKTLSDAAYLIEDRSTLLKSKKEFTAFLKWKNEKEKAN